MRRVALATLAHDRLRTTTLVVGLATVWALVAVQHGLRRGFERAARAVVDRIGGDLWVSAHGVRVVDDGEPIEAPPDVACARAVRPVIVDYTQVRTPDGALVTAQIIGVDGASRSSVPWSIVKGEANTLESRSKVGIDAADATKLGLASAERGQTVILRTGAKLEVATISNGARNFTQTPYLFMDVATAREILALPPAAATFWAIDLERGACASDVTKALAAPTRDVRERDVLARSTTSHWIDGSGIGALLTAGSVMAAVVGAAVLLGSAMTIVRTHTRELATIRALGARRGELSSFVAWQVGVVAALATVSALAIATILARVLGEQGLLVIIDHETWLAGAGLAIVSTAAAALFGARVLGRIDPCSVLE